MAAKKPVTKKKRVRKMPLVASSAVTSTNNQIWVMWNEGTGSTVTTSAASNIDIWRAWVGTGSVTTSVTGMGTSTASNTVVWGSWNTSFHAQGVQLATPEEQQRLVAERQRLNDEHYAQQRARQVEADKAQARAVRLLREHLDERQRLQLDQNGYFELETLSRNGERRKYRIHRKWSGNIQQVDDSGRRIRTLCIHPREATPIEDSMLAQKLMLEGGAEEELLRVANHS